MFLLRFKYKSEYFFVFVKSIHEWKSFIRYQTRWNYVESLGSTQKKESFVYKLSERKKRECQEIVFIQKNGDKFIE